MEGALSETNSQTGQPQRVLVVGLGTMGMSHARAYQAIDGFELVGLCTRNAAARGDLDKEFPGVPRYDGLTEALRALKPDAVAISAYTEHHAPMALEALAAGAHVFCEKPLAKSLEAAEASSLRRARRTRRCWSATSCASIPHGRASSRSAARSASRSSCA